MKSRDEHPGGAETTSPWVRSQLDTPVLECSVTPVITMCFTMTLTVLGKFENLLQCQVP